MNAYLAPATGLVFEDQAPIIASDPHRADIALFVGFVARRPASAVPAALADWLASQGWTAQRLGRRPLPDLWDVPVPIDTWQTFAGLFDWEQRPLAAHASGRTTTYLGAAVRSFFAQGGRKCYVVRVGDPFPVLADRSAGERAAALARLVPGYPLAYAATPADPAGWRGMAHVMGLPDVSLLCLPDLADIVGGQPPPPTPAALPPRPPEVFTDCSEGEPGEVTQVPARRIRAPRCDAAGYAAWARALSLAAGALARYGREVQLVAAVPLPLVGTPPAGDMLAALLGDGHGPLSLAPFAGLDGLASAFVQLAYPWPRTAGSASLPEGLESPDGVLCGLLARNALARGTFRSAAGQHLADVHDIFPVLSHEQMYRPHAGPDGRLLSLIERVSLFGPTPDGPRLLSDVTAALQEAYRPAGLNRLTAAIVRAARRLGEDLTFDPADERLWAQVRGGLERLLLGLLQAGALRGAAPAEAYRVRCDRSTMTQNDIDNGRVIVEVQFNPAAPVERITVVLALSEGGQVEAL